MHDGTLVHQQFGQWGWPKNLWVFAQSKHVICLHLDTLITAFLTAPLGLLLTWKHNVFKRQNSERRPERQHICSFICKFASFAVSELCGIEDKALRFRFSLEMDRIPRIQNLGCPQTRPGQICGWWDGWDAACCFLTTWNAIYLSARLTIQAGGRDGERQEGWKLRQKPCFLQHILCAL